MMILGILKILIVVLALAAMFMLLVGIGHLFSGNFRSSRSEMERFREHVRSHEDVLDHSNSFSGFIATPHKQRRDFGDSAAKPY